MRDEDELSAAVIEARTDYLIASRSIAERFADTVGVDTRAKYRALAREQLLTERRAERSGKRRTGGPPAGGGHDRSLMDPLQIVAILRPA